MIASYKEYMGDKMEFISRHNHDYEIYTSPMDDYGCYYKTYCFKDGAVWYEKMSPEIVPAIAEARGVRCKVEVKLFKTEFWSSESGSKVYYEQF